MNTTQSTELEQILSFLGINFINYKGKRTSNGHRNAKTIGEIKQFFGKEVPTSGQFVEDIDCFDFKNNWDDLMFLVEKIEDLGYDVNIKGISCKISPILKDHTIIQLVLGEKSQKIKLVYLACFEFVKFYNETLKPLPHGL